MTTGSEEAALGRAGAYDLLAELAAGGMATVFLARSVRGGPLVAIKRPHKHLAKDKTYLSMLVDEARLASAISHPNVVKVRELGFEGGEPFIVLDYVEGASLSDLRKALSAKERALDARVAVRIVLDALAGLQAAHVLHDDTGRHLGIVHRDVSPHNVLLGSDGKARLTDFGIAKAEDRVQITRTHEVKGKLAYLAPERIDKRRICTAQSDVFSMAVVLWECIAGRRLFRGDEAVDTLQEVMNGPIPSLRRVGVSIEAALDEAILRGLSRDLDTRYKTAAEFADAIEKASGTVASAEDVALVIETVFGARMRMRHEQMRRALTGRDVDEVLEASGLHARPSMSPPELDDAPSVDVEALARVAPPAPSGRYTFGNVVDDAARAGKRRTMLLAFALGGVTIMITAALFLVLALGPHTSANDAVEIPRPVEAPATRRVAFALPFLATKVTLDGTEKTLDPAADIVSFDVPKEAGTRHRVAATALDGTHAEAWVDEADGIGRPEGEGFAIAGVETLELPNTPESFPQVSASALAPASPHGHTRKSNGAAAAGGASAAPHQRNGFTKL